MLIKLLNRLGLRSIGHMLPRHFQLLPVQLFHLSNRNFDGGRFGRYMVYGSPSCIDYIS